MKLHVKVVGPGEGVNEVQKELTIRNPAATVANLRAAISVVARLPSTGFTIPVGGETLADDSAAPPSVGIQDGSSITAMRKEPQAETPAAAPPARRPPRSERQAGQGTSVDELIRNALADGGFDPDDMDSGSGEDFEEESIDSDLSGSLAEDAAFEFGDDGDDDEEDDEEMTPEMEEQAELTMSLLSLPNYETLKQRFDADPRAAMADIQNTHPRLFALIARHTQYFLDFVNAGGIDGTGGSDSEDVDDAEIGQQTVISPPRASATSANGAARQPTEADQRNIEELMQLGFTREQCTDAYFKAGRNPNRAAAALFESPRAAPQDPAQRPPQ